MTMWLACDHDRLGGHGLLLSRAVRPALHAGLIIGGPGLQAGTGAAGELAQAEGHVSLGVVPALERQADTTGGSAFAAAGQAAQQRH